MSQNDPSLLSEIAGWLVSGLLGFFMLFKRREFSKADELDQRLREVERRLGSSVSYSDLDKKFNHLESKIDGLRAEILQLMSKH